MFRFLLIFFFLLLTFSSCATLKSYEMIYVNDPEMQMGIMADKAFEGYVESVREGAVSQSGTKAGGGCGCN